MDNRAREMDWKRARRVHLNVRVSAFLLKLCGLREAGNSVIITAVYFGRSTCIYSFVGMRSS